MKPIEIGNSKPGFWFGDRVTVVFDGGLRKPVVEGLILGLRWCYDANEWMYCFEFGQTPTSGIIWFYEWELDDFKNNYTLEPIETGYPTEETNDESWEQIPF